MITARIVAMVIAFLCCALADADGGPQHFSSVQDFLDSIPGLEKDQSKGAYGELSGPGRRDWAGAVLWMPAVQPDAGASLDYHQFFILTQGSDGTYTVAAKSKPEDFELSTETVKYEVTISKSSVFFNAYTYWHGCGHGETHQFKYYKGQWRLVGVTFQIGAGQFEEDGSGGQDAVDIDRNVLTGNVIADIQPFNGKAVKKQFRVAPEMILFQDSTIDNELGWSKLFDAQLRGLNLGC